MHIQQIAMLGPAFGGGVKATEIMLSGDVGVFNTVFPDLIPNDRSWTRYTAGLISMATNPHLWVDNLVRLNGRYYTNSVHDHERLARDTGQIDSGRFTRISRCRHMHTSRATARR